MAMDGGPAAPKKVRKAERQILALELRKQGGSYRQIAAQLAATEGISPKYNEAAAYFDVMDALKALNEKKAELADENRRLEIERLDDLFAVYYAKALGGDTWALQACLSIMGKRAALLGLNAPVKVDQTTITVNVSAEDMVKARDKAKAFENDLLEEAAAGASPAA